MYFHKGNLTFPAVTLCNQNSFRWVVYLCLHWVHLWNVVLQRQPDWVFLPLFTRSSSLKCISIKAIWRFLLSPWAIRTHSGELLTFVYTEFIFEMYFYKGNLTFPAVTLCNQNSFRWVVYLCLHGVHLLNVFL